MDSSPPLYDLLPELYRNRDGDTGFTLKALTELLDAPRARIEANIGALYRDWFVETCEDWALPFIARLAGRDSLAGLAADRRALVADAIGFARRKGTCPALEHELKALTGWPVQIAVEVAGSTALYWDEPVHALLEAAPYQDGAGSYRFHPMGIDCPLFIAPRASSGIDAPFDRAQDAPVKLMMDADAALLERALSILIEDEKGEFQRIPADRITVADFLDWAAPADAPARVLLDPLRGRFLLTDPPVAPARVAVRFAYAAPGNVGGGPYEREMARPDQDVWVAYVHAHAMPDGDPAVPAFRTLAQALDAFRSVPDDGLIRILDSGAYDVAGRDLGAAPLVCPADPNSPRRLTIEALSGEAPALRGTLRCAGGGAGISLTLCGLWIDGWIEIEGAVEARIEHCSLHPVSARREARAGADPIAAILTKADSGAESGARPKLMLKACLTGPLALAAGTTLTAGDSAIDGFGGLAISGGAPTTLARCTLLGGAEFGNLEATDTIFGSPFTVVGESLANYCAVLEGDLSSIYESTVFGMPGYARLDPARNEELRTGASNGSEIGLFNSGHNAQRLELMETRLKETLPIAMTCRLKRQRLTVPPGPDPGTQ